MRWCRKSSFFFSFKFKELEAAQLNSRSKEGDRLNYDSAVSISCYLAAVIMADKSSRSNSCGNISLPIPFGIGADCYLNHWYAIDCISGMPFHRRINQEVLYISLKNNTMRVHQPVLNSCTPYQETSQISTVNLENSPFYFSQTSNIFTGVGCNNLVSFSSSNSL